MPVCVLPIMAPADTVAAHAHHAAARRPLFRQSEYMPYSLERDAHDKRARALPEQPPCALALATFPPATTIMMALAALATRIRIALDARRFRAPPRVWRAA